MSDEAVPCGRCGKEPEVLAPSWPDIVWRSDSDCLERVSWELPEWNARQARILAARRKDFEAGASLCGVYGRQAIEQAWDIYIKEGA